MTSLHFTDPPETITAWFFIVPLFPCPVFNDNQNTNNEKTEVMITWSRLAKIKFCVSRSRDLSANPRSRCKSKGRNASLSAYRKYSIETFSTYKLHSVTKQTFTCSKSTIETLEKGVKHWRRSGDCIVNFEHILHILVFRPLL